MEVGGGETLDETALLLLQEQAEFVSLRAPAVLILALAFWGVVLYVFRWLHIDIACIYPTKLAGSPSLETLQSPRLSCSPQRVLLMAVTFAILLLASSLLWVVGFGGPASGAPLLFLTAVGLAVSFFTSSFRDLILYTTRILLLVLSPGDDVHFLEVLVGDILTSLSRVFQEVGLSTILFLQLSYGITFAPSVYHVLPTALASLPFCLRMRQCFVCFKSSPHGVNKLLHALNIIKYCSSLPGLWLPLLLSPYRAPEEIEYIVLWYLLFNSLYSFVWDVMMDWGLGKVMEVDHIGLRPLLLFSSPGWYYTAILIDFVLRFIWLTKYYDVPELMGYNTFMLGIEVVEVVRRSMWSVFRIEWECISRGHTGYTPKAPVAEFFENVELLEESGHDL